MRNRLTSFAARFGGALAVVLVVSLWANFGWSGELPDGYTELQWIEATGSQWIISGYTPSCTDRIEMRVRFNAVDVNQCLWCSRSDSTTKQTFTGFLIGNDTLRFDRNTTAGALAAGFTPETDVDYTIVADGKTLACSVNGANVVTMAEGTFSGANNLTFFASYTVKSLSTSTAVNNKGTYRLYYVRIYNADGRLVREFLPARKDSCEETDNTRYGLFETQAQSYRTTVDTTAAFNAGDPIGLALAPILRQVYRGTPCMPALSVTNLATGAEVSASDYDVVWSGNAARGFARVDVIGKGALAGKTGYAFFPVSGTYSDEYVDIDDDSVVVKTVGDRRVYVFTDTTGEIPLKAKQALTLEEALVVGGGGAGGWGNNTDNSGTGGGGGGGGFVWTNLQQLVAAEASLAIRVGAGGSGRAHYDAVTNLFPVGGNGFPSSFVVAGKTVTAFGGGGGSSAKGALPGTGKIGSSGGIHAAPLLDYRYAGDGVYYTSSQGFMGTVSTDKSGGGGGANGNPCAPGGYQCNGSEGRAAFITGEREVYGSGGGSGGSNNYADRINGGKGGTHAGAGFRLVVGTNGASVNGDVGFGGGGGGGSTSSNAAGGDGGSGTVILSFSVGDQTAKRLNVAPLANQPYDGEGLACPKPVVRCGEKTLTLGTDYTLSYANNLTNSFAANYAWVTVTGAGTYAGRVVTVPFRAVRVLFATLDAAEAAAGTNWVTATTLADAVTRAGTDWEVWLKAGTYVRTANQTVNKTIAIRGGFAGDDSDPAKLADFAYTVFDGNDALAQFLYLKDGTFGYYTTIERCWFKRGTGSMTSRYDNGGSTVFLDCKFTDGCYPSGVTGGGFSFGGYGSRGKAIACFFGCDFVNNRLTGGTAGSAGFAIAVNTGCRLTVEDCLFASNGLPLSSSVEYGQGANGACIYLNGNHNSDGRVGLTARRCRFIGNRLTLRNFTYSAGGSGAGVYMTGKCTKSTIENCLFLGNETSTYQGSPKSNPGGVLHIASSTPEETTVTVSRCTFAYNLHNGIDSAAALHVAAGVANVSDSIFYGNVVSDKNAAPPDIYVAATGIVDVRRTLFTSAAEANPAQYMTAVDATKLTLSDIVYGDPQFITPQTTFVETLRSSTGDPAVPVSPHYFLFDETIAANVYAFDAHLMSPGAFYDNAGVLHEGSNVVTSAAILDDGTNLGCYGGTTEASKLPEINPTVEDVKITWEGGCSQPRITFTPGHDKGSAYNAKITVSYSVEGGSAYEKIYTNVPSDVPFSALAAFCLPPGSTYTGLVTVEAGGKTITEPFGGTVDAPYSPYWGKGGGAAKVVHVRPGATGAGTGDNWFDAMTDFHTALSYLTAERNELWVAGDKTLSANPTTYSPSFAVAIRGGFVGTENAPAGRPVETLSTLDGDNAYRPLTLANAGKVAIERMRFTRSVNQGLVKTGTGDLTLTDCAFTLNGTNRMLSVSGRGANVSGTAGVTVLVVSNCLFAGNAYYSEARDSVYSEGFGLALSQLKTAELFNTSFVTNGAVHTSEFSVDFFHQPGATCATAIYAASVPVVARNCRFVGNRSNSAANGGTVYLSGACGGSAFTNCLWVGNSDQKLSHASETGATGALRVSLSSQTDRVDVVNCTLAYNLAAASGASAGITLNRGTLTLRNSLFWGNITPTANTAGSDLTIGAEATCDMAYTLFASNAVKYVSTNAAATVVYGPGLVYADPQLVSSSSDFLACCPNGYAVPKTSVSSYQLYLKHTADVADALCALDVHVKGKVGYYDEKTGRYICQKGHKSPAVDAGDPTSPFDREPELGQVGDNGRRVNLGFYGNTPYATMSPVRGAFLRVR